MSKKIEDYLHLYLGCELSNGLKLDHYMFLYGNLQKLTSGSIKIRLRPLSDMKEEEMLECGNLVYDFSNDESGLGLNKWDYTNFQTLLCAEQFQWLLNRGFDLFGLIESGLAIDSTTTQ